MTLLQKILIAYWLFINLLTFILFFRDKKAAVKGRWRTPERTLLTAAFLGGGCGGLLGMYLCRHKTKKAKFYLLVPLFFVVQTCLFVLAYARLGISLLAA